MYIVTSGTPYIDIDAYAGIVAYADLLKVQGISALSVSTSTANESVTRTILGWGDVIVKNYSPNQYDKFVVIDLSNPDSFDPIVDLKRVVQIIDHHPGYEKYWSSKIGEKAVIEPVGAACTQVFEQWQKANKLHEMSPLNAKLLMSGILDNTLNFGARITTKRDHYAYNSLLPISGLSDDWPAQYFNECQDAIESDLENAIKNDTKKDMINLPKSVGQLVVWNAKKILSTSKKEIENIMREDGDEWFINLISISEGRSILIAENPRVKNQIENLLKVEFNGSMAIADRLWLRKEIQKAAL
jgi:inorganic pyrophosphatase